MEAGVLCEWCLCETNVCKRVIKMGATNMDAYVLWKCWPLGSSGIRNGESGAVSEDGAMLFY